MIDPLSEPLLPEVVEAKPIESQRFLHQCSICASLKFEILLIQEQGIKSLILVCQKGHKSIMKGVPEFVNE